MGEELHWCKLGVQRAVAFHRLSCDSLPLAGLWERGGENPFSLLPRERRSNSILSPRAGKSSFGSAIDHQQ